MIYYSTNNTINNKIHNDYYQHLLQKKSLPNIYLGINTTNTCCRFGCIQNSWASIMQSDIVFATKLQHLTAFGFKECKFCNPLSQKAPDNIKDELTKIQNDVLPARKNIVFNNDLVQFVQKNHQIDIIKYICIKRANYILENAESLVSSSKQQQFLNIKSNIFFHKYHTPLGVMVACYSEEELYLLEFMDRKFLEAELLYLAKKYKTYFVKKNTKISKQLEQQLTEYFNGKRQNFDIPLKIHGSDFQQEVMSALQLSPYGETISYKEQAIAIGEPTKIRAVANANGKNSIGIIIPCHRVIGHNGSLTGYGGGLDRKRWLLNLEKSNCKGGNGV